MGKEEKNEKVGKKVFWFFAAVLFVIWFFVADVFNKLMIVLLRFAYIDQFWIPNNQELVVWVLVAVLIGYLYFKW